MTAIENEKTKHEQTSIKFGIVGTAVFLCFLVVFASRCQIEADKVKSESDALRTGIQQAVDRILQEHYLKEVGK